MLTADTFGTPPGDSRRELLAFCALTFVTALAGCAVLSALHFIIR
jgi:hypothetical protein